MSTTKKSGSDGFSEAERAAIKERAQELKAQGRSGQKKAENERAVLDAIAEMPNTTFDEAVRLCVAVFEKTDWAWVDREIKRRDSNEPALGLGHVYAQVINRTKALSV